MLLFCIGIGILQSGIPATTSLLIHSLKGRTAVGVSLSFVTAIIIGAAANVFSIQQILLHTPDLLLILLLCLLFAAFGTKE